MSDEKKKKGKRKAVRLVIDLLTVVCLIVAGYSIYQIAKQKSEIPRENRCMKIWRSRPCRKRPRKWRSLLKRTESL